MAQDKRTMTLNLTAAEMDALDKLASKKELSKTSVMRQALRLYQLIDARTENGDKLFFEDADAKKAEVMML